MFNSKATRLMIKCNTFLRTLSLLIEQKSVTLWKGNPIALRHPATWELLDPGNTIKVMWVVWARGHWRSLETIPWTLQSYCLYVHIIAVWTRAKLIQSIYVEPELSVVSHWQIFTIFPLNKDLQHWYTVQTVMLVLIQNWKIWTTLYLGHKESQHFNLEYLLL